MTDTKKQTSEHERETRPDHQDGLWDKVGDVAGKGLDVLKSGAGKAGQITKQATRLSMLKLEIHNLHNAVDGVFVDVGKKLWFMKKEGDFKELDTAFAVEFKRLAELEKELETKEKQAQETRLIEAE